MSLIHNANVVRDGLVLYLDAANPKSYPGSGTTWYDLSGNGNHGTLTNGPTYSSDNKGYISLDGLDDYINGPLVSGLGNSITVEMCINLTSSMSNRIFFGIDTNDHASLGIFLNADSTSWYWNTGDSYNTPFSNIPSVLISYWYNITISTSLANNNAKLYSNSIFIGTSNYKNTVTSGVGDKYQIGRYFNNAYWAPVKYSIFKIYNRALSAEEITQNFEATRGR